MEQNGASEMIKKINDENGDLCDFGEDLYKAQH